MTGERYRWTIAAGSRPDGDDALPVMVATTVTASNLREALRAAADRPLDEWTVLDAAPEGGQA